MNVVDDEYALGTGRTRSGGAEQRQVERPVPASGDRHRHAVLETFEALRVQEEVFAGGAEAELQERGENAAAAAALDFALSRLDERPAENVLGRRRLKITLTRAGAVVGCGKRHQHPGA